MFGSIENVDITKDLLIDQLITSTDNCGEPIWARTDFRTYTEYLFQYRLTEKSKMCFKLIYYLTHDGHTLNVYLNKNNGMLAISVMLIMGQKLLPLVKKIEDTEKYFYLRKE